MQSIRRRRAAGVTGLTVRHGCSSVHSFIRRLLIDVLRQSSVPLTLTPTKSPTSAPAAVTVSISATRCRSRLSRGFVGIK